MHLSVCNDYTYDFTNVCFKTVMQAKEIYFWINFPLLLVLSYAIKWYGLCINVIIK